MKNAKFIVGVLLGCLFAIVAADGVAILIYHLYWSLTYSVLAASVAIILSVASFRWAIRSGIRAPKLGTRD